MNHQKRIEGLEEAAQKCLEQAERLRALAQQETESGYMPRPGEIAEFKDSGSSMWFPDMFERHDESTWGSYVCQNSSWQECRPLQEPLVLQFRPHTPGDPMPCDGLKEVHVLRRDGIVVRGPAHGVSWDEIIIAGHVEIIGWLPVGERA